MADFDYEAELAAAMSADPVVDTQDTSTAQPESSAPPAESVDTGTSPQEPEAPQTQEPAQSDWNPEGPGNIREALRQERELRRQLEQQNAQYQAYLAQMQQAQQPQVDPLDPEAFQHTQQQIGKVRSELQMEMLRTRVQIAEDLTRAAHPDYDQVISIFADPKYASRVNVQSFLNEPNPAKAAYDFAKQLRANDPAHIQQLIREEAAKLAAQAATAKAPVAPPSLGGVPAAAPNNDAKGDPAAISTDQLARMDGDQIDAWYRKALGG